jgi:hypothetical protein
MAVKKVTSRTRSTTKTKTKGAKTTRSATKRPTKAKTAAKRTRVAYTPTAAVPVVPALKPTIAFPAVQAPAKAPKAVTSTEPRPSQFSGDHYLHVTGPEPAEGTPRRPGKWMIFVTRTRVDALWEEIRRAVVAGRLGHAAKVSTALPDPLSPDPKKHMICVYTANEDDAADVRRVRGVLRGLGITWKIPYKSDAPARAGQYEGMAGPAAKYYE